MLLGACCSPPIRVLANNDVPTGAAYIALTLPLRNDWDGWRGGPFKARLLPSESLCAGPSSLACACEEGVVNMQPGKRCLSLHSCLTCSCAYCPHALYADIAHASKQEDMPLFVYCVPLQPGCHCS